jgi:RNA polymerase sigma factor (sigma-70 family)
LLASLHGAIGLRSLQEITANENAVRAKVVGKKHLARRPPVANGEATDREERIGAVDVSTGGTTQFRALIARLKNGDGTALDVLLSQFRQRFVLIARRMLRNFPRVRNAVETDDIVQGASLRLIRALMDSRVQESLLQDGSVRGFLALAAKQMQRELVDLARYYRKRAPHALPDSDPPVPESSVSLDDAECFHDAVDKLREDLKAVFTLRYYNGLSTEETAEELDLSTRSVQLKFAEAKVCITNACRPQFAA